MGAAGNRFLTIGAAAGSLALLAALVLMLWPLDPTDHTFTPTREQPDGEAVGWVSKVESNTIHVNSGPFGGGVVPLVVTKATRIMVGSKEGWFEDIRPGGQVKVAYELYQGRRFARSVELLVDEGTGRFGRTPAHLKSTAGAPATLERAPAKVTSSRAPAARPAPAPGAAEPPPAMPSVAAPVAAPRPAAAAKPAPAAPPEVRLAPRPGLVPTKPAEIVPPPQRGSTPTPTRNVAAPDNAARAPEPSRAVEPPRPAAPRPVETPGGGEGGETTDGSAAVDWLLKGRR
ncbi:MAG: hypothetical protein WEG40_03530 [Candidatus Rokuibacteriota bacterium]